MRRVVPRIEQGGSATIVRNGPLGRGGGSAAIAAAFWATTKRRYRRGPTGPCPRSAVRTSWVHARRPRRRRPPAAFRDYRSGQPGRSVRDATSAKILAEVGPCPLTPFDLGVDRSLDRDALARRVFADLVLVDFAFHDGADVRYRRISVQPSRSRHARRRRSPKTSSPRGDTPMGCKSPTSAMLFAKFRRSPMSQRCRFPMVIELMATVALMPPPTAAAAASSTRRA